MLRPINSHNHLPLFALTNEMNLLLLSYNVQQIRPMCITCASLHSHRVSVVSVSIFLFKVEQQFQGLKNDHSGCSTLRISGKEHVASSARGGDRLKSESFWMYTLKATQYPGLSLTEVGSHLFGPPLAP